jgi:glycosyltransferase involved in cell wall biosynthesis
MADLPAEQVNPLRVARERVIRGLHGESDPLVSVIVPAYNVSRYIYDTLASVLGQTLTNFEVILVNDGSPDTEELERAIQPFRSRIVYLKQENKGPGAARNLGIVHARGQYLAFLDGDDSWLPGYLDAQMRMFEERPSLEMVYADAQVFGDTPFSGETYMKMCPSDGSVDFESLVSERCQVITSCTVVRRRIFSDCGLFDVELRGTEDFHMWIRAAHGGVRIAYHRAVLGRYRIHSGSLSSSPGRMHLEFVRALKKIESAFSLSPERSSLVQSQIERFQAEYDLEQGKSYLFCGRIDQARQSLRKANAYFCKPKLRMVLMGLTLAPWLTRLGVKIWLGRERDSKQP